MYYIPLGARLEEYTVLHLQVTRNVTQAHRHIYESKAALETVELRKPIDSRPVGKFWSYPY